MGNQIVKLSIISHHRQAREYAIQVAQETRVKAEARIRKMCEGASTLWKGASKTASNIGKSAGGVITDFGKGAVAGVINALANSNPGKAIAEAITGKAIHADLSGGNNSLAYNVGEFTSSLVTGVGGTLLVTGGGALFTGSGAGTVLSGGSSSPVTVPGMAAGATLVIAGGSISIGAGVNAIEAGQNVIQNIVGGDGNNINEVEPSEGSKTPSDKEFTEHGADQAVKRGYSASDVDKIIDNWSNKFYQPNGRTVYVKRQTYGYDVVIIDKNGKGVVSVIGGNSNNGVGNTLPDLNAVKQMLNNQGGYSTIPMP
ncbi:hypothetical protein IW492_14205 [Enterococcus sp. BWB1-3]|uniref:hypothetical protein n=1 Tax=Enterococcus sp. BWB1-3 TaxID=2787713 RepID=UPI0019213EB2|nr:hypothetical protein [Enterococcus sp. BWB1-3]MBL1230383.1 hypothetical protein [Enterococcus sp. BWB1-3]